MKYKVEYAWPVEDFLRRLPPEPKHALRRNIKALATLQGDIKPLEGRLAGYWRLRVMTYRVIFATGVERGEGRVQCLYAGPRATVYEAFTAILAKKIAGQMTE